jgi:glycosyltransferase involved in cell wall biosynthesis
MRPTAPHINYSVVILTLNEEIDLPGCLASVRHCDDIALLDSGSTDRTLDIGRNAGARIVSRAFDNFAGQRNFAQREIRFRHPWVFHLDADERFTPALDQECRVAAARTDVDGFFVAPKMLWRGKWIPRSTDFPAWQARFVRAPEFQFVEVGHGQREAAHMRMDRLQSNYTHDLSSGGETEWLARHRRYAKAEARQHVSRADGNEWRGLVSHDPLIRRRALKQLSYRLPFRPALRFVYQYFVRGGILDGGAGLKYCRLLAKYERYTAEELRNLRRQQPPLCG